MKELDKTYNPATVEDKWYSYWLENKLFASKPNPEKEPYTIVIPPPNVTGILHMGHMLNNTIQDVLIRRARMQGKEACWVPGTDHASIATEAKVVNMLKEQGIDKEEIGREKFLEHAWDWKEKYGGIILEQLKKLGASCDWDRTRFTMEPEMNKAVNKIFVDLYDKGYIYRDYRMGNWDPEGKTALSDDEVIHKDVTAHLYYVKYAIEGSEFERALSDYIFKFQKSEGEFTNRNFNETLNKDIRVSFDGQEFHLLDLEIENEIGERINIGELSVGTSSSSCWEGCATFKFIDLLIQNKIEKLFFGDKEFKTKKTSRDDKSIFLIEATVSGKEYLTIATTRPETIMADTAICVNPDDERFKHLVGKKAIVPLVNRPIPIIADDYVDVEFGTGCLKVTPAHDVNDYEIGKRHNLPVIDLLTADGKLNEKAQFFVGEDRAKARKMTAKKLDELGLLVKTEQLNHSVGFSERTNAVVEPRLSMQWYVKMEELTKPALDNVMNDTIKFFPEKFKNTYKHWMENVRDWCISRQLWWGHRIPIWYLPNGEFVSGETVDQALERAQKIDASITIDQLQQDEDVLDTWFSSGLWPISVFDGLSNPGNPDIEYYYPTNVLVTAPEILFFWVARMVMYGYEYMGEKPFSDVYLTGIVRDKQRRKMSKQLGNSPDALELIKKHGADGIRTGMLFSSPAGNDLLFDEKLCEQGSGFSNKIWNAYRLVNGWEIDESLDGSANQIAIDWFDSRFNQAFAEIEDNYEKYRLSDSLMSIYKLIWNDFCSWYLEMVKPVYGQPIDRATLDATIVIFEKLMRLLHPLMPFITEELWQMMGERADGESICVAEYPKGGGFDKALLENTETMFDIISQIRNTRQAKQISPKTALELSIKTDNQALFAPYKAMIQKLANISAIIYTQGKPEGSVSFVQQSHECFLPIAGEIDTEKEKAEMEKELKRMKGFLIGVSKKLSNEKFVANAPEQVLEKERQKQADAESKIKVLEESLAGL